MEITMIVGWVFLILSWIIPPFIKNLLKKRFVGISLSGLATNIFISHLLTIIF